MKYKMKRNFAVLLCLVLVVMTVGGCTKSSTKDEENKGKNDSKKESVVKGKDNSKDSDTDQDIQSNPDSEKEDSSNSVPTASGINSSTSNPSTPSSNPGTSNPSSSSPKPSTSGTSVSGMSTPSIPAKPVTLNGVGFEIGAKITVEIVLKTTDTGEISVNPCVRMFKRVNGQLQLTDKWNHNFDEEDLAMHVTHGGPQEDDNGSLYGYWYSMGNFEVEGYTPVTNFSDGKAVLRFTLTLPETGEYVLQVNDEHFGEQGHNKYTNALSLIIR